MNNKIYQTMAYDQIKQQLRQHIVSASGYAELQALTPSDDQQWVQTQIDETKDGADIYRLTGGFRFPSWRM